ncbi:MAG TPA: hypothetical protein VGA22_11790 [Gemmatimonadales bacterium]
MALPPSPTSFRPGITRRRAVAQLSLVGACGALAACTPLRIVLRWYPEDFQSDPELVRGVLAGFADAVVPSDGNHAHAVAAAYQDARFPLAKYAPFLASDLTRRAYATGRETPFERLTRSERTRIIEDALRVGGVTARLYGGAIFLTQIVFYAGLWCEDGSCTEIDFGGPYRFEGLAAVTYPNPQAFLPTPLSANGNPS